MEGVDHLPLLLLARTLQHGNGQAPLTRVAGQYTCPREHCCLDDESMGLSLAVCFILHVFLSC